MKSIITISFALFLIHLSYSQSIVGLWQANTPSVNAAYLNTYQFFPDSTFRFNTNEFDGLHRIISIGGVYHILNDQIEFIVHYTIEIEGGSLQRDSVSTASDTWAINDGNIIQIPVQTPVTQKTTFWIGETNEGIDSMSIDMRKYYRIDYDPNALK